MAKIANSQTKGKFETCKDLLASELPTLSQYVGDSQLARQLEKLLPPVSHNSFPHLEASYLLLDLTLREPLISILSNMDILALLDQILESPESYYNDLKEAQEGLIELDHSYKPFYGLEKLRTLFFLSYEIRLKESVKVDTTPTPNFDAVAERIENLEQRIAQLKEANGSAEVES